MFPVGVRCTGGDGQNGRAFRILSFKTLKHEEITFREVVGSDSASEK